MGAIPACTLAGASMQPNPAGPDLAQASAVQIGLAE